MTIKEQKEIKFVDLHLAEDQKPTEETLHILTILTFQRLFTDFGNVQKNKAIIKCSNGTLTMEQEVLDREKEIFSQTFIMRLKSHKGKFFPLMKVVWNDGVMESISTNLKFDPDSEDCYKDLIDAFIELGDVDNTGMPLSVIFGYLGSETIECISMFSSEKNLENMNCVNELPI